MGWENAPFIPGINNILNNESFKLPFIVTSGSQQGHGHIKSGLNNQDSISIKLNKNYLISVICDGRSTNSSSLSYNSSNHVGSNLISLLICNSISSFIDLNPKEQFTNKLLSFLETSINDFIRNILKKISTDENEMSFLLDNMFSTTIICVVIINDYYYIINSGDGVYAINGSIESITDSYNKPNIKKIGNTFFQNIRLITEGKTSHIDSIFIGSDGFNSKEIINNKYFKDYINLPIKSDYNNVGYSNDLQNFRIHVLNNVISNDYVNWPKDDASFVLIKKVNKQ